MFLDGKSFVYNGKSSEPYELFFANVDTKSNMNLGGDIELTTIKAKRSGKNYIQDTDYNKPLEFDAEIVTKTLITDDKLHEINAWLLNQLEYKKLYVNDPDYKYKNVYFNCIFTSVERIEGCMGDQGYGTYGFKVTIKCNAPWAWEDEKTITYSTIPTNSYLVFNNTSDCNDYMYPTLQFTTGSTAVNIAIPTDKTVTIQQVTDNNRLTSVTNLSASETITMSVCPSVITSNLGLDHYSKFNKKWIRFLVGENRFTVTGDVSELKIIYTNARVV